MTIPRWSLAALALAGLLGTAPAMAAGWGVAKATPAATLTAPTSPAAAAPVSCVTRADLGGALKDNPALTWAALRAACQSDIDHAQARDPIGHSWFLNAGNGFVGTPLVLQKLLPDLAPEIWGPASENFARFGLFADPEEGRILPRGLGITAASGRPLGADGQVTGQIDYSKPDIYFVTLACGACHSGQANTPQGRQVIEGAPNTQFDVRKWRAAFGATARNFLTPDKIGTVEAPGETVKTLISLIDSKPAGFFATGLPGIAPAQILPVDGFLRGGFKAHIVPILTKFAQGTAVRGAAVALQTRPGGSYGQSNSPGLGGFSAGQSDGSGDLIVDLLAAQKLGAGVAPADFLAASYPELPRFATVTDAPSVWRQIDRTVGQWDGSVLDPFWRNIAAQLPIVGVPGAVDLHNTWIVAEYLQGMPAAPYPFDVDLTLAAKGEALFRDNCADCHHARNNRRYWELQTDFNRAAVLNAPASALFLKAFAESCHDRDFTFVTAAGVTRRPCVARPAEILNDTSDTAHQGYVTGPLDGLWARAPYLHNGSVPTLAHLLAPATRPAKFLRGVIDYDTKNLGWIWHPSAQPDYARTMLTMSVVDTSRDGLSNRGHDHDITLDGKFYRLDWSSSPEDLAALIEYLKTR